MSFTSLKGRPTFESCILGLAAKPGVAAALGFEEDTSSVDIRTGAQLLRNLKESVKTTLSSSGPRHVDKKRIIESTASVIIGEETPNMASVTRVTGISADVLRKGKELKERNDSALSSSLSSCIPTRYTHAYPLDQVHDWYHTQACTQVMLDKSRKTHYQRKSFKLPNGNCIRLSCEPRILLT